MKILVLQSELGVLRGGGESFTRNLFGTLSKRGYTISSAFVAACSGFYPLALPNGIEPLPLRGWWSRKPGQSTLSLLMRCAPSGAMIDVLGQMKDSLDWRGARWHDRRFHRRVLRELGGILRAFDAVYVHGNIELARDIAACRPTILRLPGPVSADQAATLARVQVVCANGDALEQLRHLLATNLAELPVGLDTRLFSPGESSIRGRFGWSASDRVIGYVGRLTQLKGVDLLAEAFLRVAPDHPEARLLIVGTGAEERRLRHVLSDYLERGTARILPGLDAADLPAVYRGMDVFVLSSRYENFSNALLEASACGIPFIASDVGGNRMLQAFGGGTLFQAASAEALGARLSEFLARAESARAEALRLSSHVRAKYSWDASADEFERILALRLSLEIGRGPRAATDGEGYTSVNAAVGIS